MFLTSRAAAEVYLPIMMVVMSAITEILPRFTVDKGWCLLAQLGCEYPVTSDQLKIGRTCRGDLRVSKAIPLTHGGLHPPVPTLRAPLDSLELQPKSVSCFKHQCLLLDPRLYKT
jgi:hypothetical protein